MNNSSQQVTYDYIDDYDQFMGNYKKTEVSGEEVGEFIMKMTGYYIRYNIRYSDAIRLFSAVKSDFQNRLDPANNKPMSSAKAQMLADSTPEAATYEIARIHVQNLEQIINSMKSLQKGVLTEYANSK
jgi:hypothetical protein